uniref:Large ribosomal subunit protein mL49 n=2 Tax=Clastoptera arizonana TaxID=38151 RepID=A0A1B6D1U2_9HEMI
MSYLRNAIKKFTMTSKSFINHETTSNTNYVYNSLITQMIQKRYSQYRSSENVGDPSEYTSFEITENPEEWKFVERLLPQKMIPTPILKDKYPSGWCPQIANPEKQEYYVERTRNHMMPVYLDISFRGQRRITYVSKIEGDIWDFNNEVTDYLKKLEKRPIASRVNEVRRLIMFKGDHVNNIKQFLMKKGL